MNPMDEIRNELGYEYDASNEFDMPLDFYGEEVSTETKGE